MNKSLVILAMILVLFAGWASAEELLIEVDLGTQIGPSFSKAATFAFDIPIEQINEISLRLEGTYRDQEYICGSTPGMIMAYAPGRFGVLFGDDAIQLPEFSTIHYFPGNSGDWLPYDLTFRLVEGDLSSLDFLKDGNTQVGVDDLPSSRPSNDGRTYFNCSPMTPCATISKATLIIGTYDQVPVSNQSWGTVKAIYRYPR